MSDKQHESTHTYIQDLELTEGKKQYLQEYANIVKEHREITDKIAARGSVQVPEDLQYHYNDLTTAMKEREENAAILVGFKAPNQMKEIKQIAEEEYQRDLQKTESEQADTHTSSNNTQSSAKQPNQSNDRDTSSNKKDAEFSPSAPSSKDKDEKSIAINGIPNPVKQRAMPLSLLDKYSIHPSRSSSIFKYKGSDKEAFRDKGDKFVTKDSNSNVAKSMVELAESKGWESIKASGSKEFRKHIWLEASLKGLDVKGFKPNENDLAELAALQKKQPNVVFKHMASDNKEATANTAASASAKSSPDNATVTGNNGKQTGGGNKTHTTVDPEHEKENYKQRLLDSFSNEPPSVALKKFPELKELYGLTFAAERFTREAKNKDSSKLFVESVRDRGINELANGNKLPAVTQNIKQQAYDASRLESQNSQATESTR